LAKGKLQKFSVSCTKSMEFAPKIKLVQDIN